MISMWQPRSDTLVSNFLRGLGRQTVVVRPWSLDVSLDLCRDLLRELVREWYRNEFGISFSCPAFSQNFFHMGILPRNILQCYSLEFLGDVQWFLCVWFGFELLFSRLITQNRNEKKITKIFKRNCFQKVEFWARCVISKNYIIVIQFSRYPAF